MIWIFGLLAKLRFIKRFGRPVIFTPDYKVGRFFIGTVSAFEYAVFNDALRALSETDMDVAESNHRYYMLRLTVIAACCCDRWGFRLFDYKSDSALLALQQLPRELLEELALGAYEKTRIPWVLPDDEYNRRFSQRGGGDEDVAVNP